LIVAVEVCVGHLAQHRIIRAWPTCNRNESCTGDSSKQVARRAACVL
jgi:hypothetical protein